MATAAGTREAARSAADAGAVALARETAIDRVAIAVIGLHVVDDNFLQPNAGTSAGDHLVSGLVPLALLVLAGVLYERLRPGVRATIALVAGFFGILAGTAAVHNTRQVGATGDDATGHLSIPAG